MYEFWQAVNPVNIFTGLQEFMQTGGWVLNYIMAATFLMWTLILERYWYYWTEHGKVLRRARKSWDDRAEHTSWQSHRIREQLISEVKMSTEQSMNVLKALIAILPMLGLMGTVTGMIEVFDVLSASGSSNARGMAAGVMKATIPTMSGMVASLSGLFFVNSLEQKSKHETHRIADDLQLT